MIIREEYLVVINSKNKIQRVKLQLNKDSIGDLFTICRITGQYGGKETLQPELRISSGKVKRTAAEQATLQFNGLLKQYLDKGYVNLLSVTSKKYDDLTEDEIKALLGNKTTDQSGVPKPMLAKSADDCSSDIWNKDWWASRKLDGTRCLMYFKNGEIHTASRGGGTYDISTKHLRKECPQLLEIFRLRPDLILDGELYHHGSDWPLQRISGVARLKEWSEECRELQYWIYDYVSSEPFNERLKYLESLKPIFKDSKYVKIVDHVKINGYLAAKKLHDKFVAEGFEGLCARNPEREYGINKRSAVYLIKMKEFRDAEFKIVGIKEGLRPEDMCFTLVTDDNKEFNAKPMGDIATRVYYLNHKDEFIGKKATCKYFYLSKDGVPTLPVMKSIRPDDE